MITATTNKVETYHQLSKWVEFGTGFIARTNDPYEMEKAIKYNTIITNSLVLQNVIDISNIVQGLR
jgi:TnpA family transposase